VEAAQSENIKVPMQEVYEEAAEWRAVSVTEAA
jgi:hypothetical protein